MTEITENSEPTQAPSTKETVISKEEALEVAVEYFTTTNKVARDKVVKISPFGYSRLYAAPYTLTEVTEIFGSYPAFIEAVNKEIKGADKRIRSPRLVSGQFTRVEQVKRNAEKAEKRRVKILEEKIALLSERAERFRDEAIELETKADALDDEILILSSQLDGGIDED